MTSHKGGEEAIVRAGRDGRCGQQLGTRAAGAIVSCASAGRGDGRRQLQLPVDAVPEEIRVRSSGGGVLVVAN